VADVIPFEKRRKPAKAASAPSDTTVLDDAIAKICAIELKIKAADGSKCLHALDAGDLLKPINATIAHGKWGAFCKACGVSTRSARVYIQLANSRGVIEEANAQRAADLPPLPPMSIREALKLIGPKQSEPKQSEVVAETEPPTESITVEEVMAWLLTATPDEKRQVATEVVTADNVLTWLLTASHEDKRKIAARLAQDTAAMRKLLPAKVLPKKATDQQVFRKAMALLTVEAPAIN
jgi:hypothetical protein